MILTITTVGAVVMVPWIIYLSNTLRGRHRVTMWDTAWIGFDIFLLVVLAASALAVWRRKMVAVVLLTAAAVTLLIDAWFDVTLSWGTKEQSIALLTAVIAELPLAIILLATVRVALLRWSRLIASLRGEVPDSRSVLSQPMPMAHQVNTTEPLA